MSEAVLLSIFKSGGRCEHTAREGKKKNLTPFQLGLSCKILSGFFSFN